MEMFLVGGAVRDLCMQRVSKDWDFTVVLPLDTPEPFDFMRLMLAADGFEEFLADEQHGTVRARAPKQWTFGGTKPPVNTFDFVLARRDVSTDGRHAITAIGTLDDDLARRDFTMNAMAIDADGAIIDPHNGQRAILDRSIRTVGNPFDRFREDGLRVLRALRFAVTLGFNIDPDTREAMLGMTVDGRWRNGVSSERVREELQRAFAKDTVSTVLWLKSLHLLESCFTDGLWLKPTLEGR